MIKKMKLNADTISYMVMSTIDNIDNPVNIISDITKIPYVLFPECASFKMVVFQIHRDAFTNTISVKVSLYTCGDGGMHLVEDVRDSVDYSIDREDLINRWAMLIVNTLERWIPTCMDRDAEFYSKYLSFDDVYTIFDGTLNKVKNDDDNQES